MAAIWVLAETSAAASRLVADAGLASVRHECLTWDDLDRRLPEVSGVDLLLLEWPAAAALARQHLPVVQHLTDLPIWAVTDDAAAGQAATEAGVSVVLRRPLHREALHRALGFLLQPDSRSADLPPSAVRERRELRFDTLARLHRELSSLEHREEFATCLAEGLAGLLDSVAVVRLPASPRDPEVVRGAGVWTGADLHQLTGTLAQCVLRDAVITACDGAAVPERRPDPIGRRALLLPLTHGLRATGLVLIRRPLPYNLDEVSSASLLTTQAAAMLACLSREAEAEERLVQSLLSALTVRDAATRWHSERAATYARVILDTLGVDPGQAEWQDGIRGTLLHDVGKIGVPDDVLFKADLLTEPEWTVIRRHVDHSYHLLTSVRSLAGAAAVAHAHHERFDGGGYPRGLAGDAIPLGARVCAVADAFDAITSNRPYRRAADPESARAEIERCAGTQFDPVVVEAFNRAFRRIVDAAAA